MKITGFLRILVGLIICLNAQADPAVPECLSTTPSNSSLVTTANQNFAIANLAGSGLEIALQTNPLTTDYCQRYCSQVSMAERCDCTAFNKEFSELKSKFPSAPDDFIEAQLGLNDVMHMRTGSASDSGIRTAGACITGTSKGIKDSIFSSLDGMWSFVKAVFHYGSGEGILDLWNHRDDIKKIIGDQYRNCTSEAGLMGQPNCILSALVNSDAFAKKIGQALSDLTDQLAGDLTQYLQNELRGFHCSSPTKQLEMRCHLQARMYTEVLLAAGGAELGKAIAGIVRAGAGSEEAQSAIAKIRAALIAKVPQASSAFQASQKAFASGLRLTADVAEAARVLKRNFLGKLTYGSDFKAAFGVDLDAGGKPTRYVVQIGEQFLEVRPGDALYQEISIEVEKTKRMQAVATQGEPDTLAKNAASIRNLRQNMQKLGLPREHVDKFIAELEQSMLGCRK